jgi:DNA-binding beta-propeller fold protein YncE
MEFTSGATTVLECWPALPGSVVHGLAIDSGTGNVYVADAGNNLVEVYSPTGSLLKEFGDPGPAAHETAPFAPSCIAFSSGFIYVGDTANDYIDVFQ